MNIAFYVKTSLAGLLSGKMSVESEKMINVLKKGYVPSGKSRKCGWRSKFGTTKCRMRILFQ